MSVRSGVISQDERAHVAELEAQAERYRSIIETTTDALMIVDREGVVRFANRAAEQLFERSTNELIDHPFGFPVVLGESTEVDILRKTGQVVAELRMANTIWEGQPAGIASLRDITQRKEAEERERLLISEQAARAVAEESERRIQSLYEEAKRANQAKSDFMAVMSHELRTPLNAVIGYSDLLLLGLPSTLSDGAQSHVERIRSSAQHLLGMIEQVLTYARVEGGREHLEIEPFDPNRVVSETAETIRPAAIQKGLVLGCQLADPPEYIRSDRRMLQQILMNLLSNAVKFTDKGEVGIGLSLAAGTARFLVWDTGIGIHDESLANVFEPFWQVDRSYTRRAEGTGLGLTVAHRLASLLGGQLSVESKPGAGTSITLSLPFNAGHA